MNLGSALRRRRADLGLRQRQVAERVGITEDYLGLIERGQRSPSADLLEKLSEELHVPVSWVFLESEPVNPNLPAETAVVVEEAKNVAARLLRMIDELQRNEEKSVASRSEATGDSR
jgi:transcriptional regulator with XRE-family HTH domain